MLWEGHQGKVNERKLAKYQSGGEASEPELEGLMKVGCREFSERSL